MISSNVIFFNIPYIYIAGMKIFIIISIRNKNISKIYIKEER